MEYHTGTKDSEIYSDNMGLNSENTDLKIKQALSKKYLYLFTGPKRWSTIDNVLDIQQMLFEKRKQILLIEYRIKLYEEEKKLGNPIDSESNAMDVKHLHHCKAEYKELVNELNFSKVFLRPKKNQGMIGKIGLRIINLCLEKNNQIINNYYIK